MKTLIKSIVYKESPLYLYGHGPFKTHNKIFFNHDAYFELETNTLVSDHSSGFGANLFTLLGPLMFLAHRNIFPSSIKTFVGFKNFMDKSTNEPLKDLFIAPQTLRAQSTELRPPSFRPYYLNVCYYLNPWGNYKRITFCPLLTFVLDRYFTPKKELFDKADRFFKDKGIEPIDFGVGDPKESTPGIIRNYTKRAIDKERESGYPSYIGSTDFRESITKWNKERFGVSLDAATEITSTIGSKEGIFNFAEGFINPGDYSLVPTPGYPPWSRGTLFAEGKSHFMPLLKENDFLPKLDKIPSDIVKKAKILWINYPNNPTSAIATKEFLKEAVDFGADNNIIVASDEAYSEFYYEESDKPHSILEFANEGVVAFNSLSKRSFMTTYRVGWVAGDKRIIDIFKKVKTNVDSGTSTFIQDGAVAAYSDESHVKQMRTDYKRKRDYLCNALTDIGLPDCTPKATMYIWQKVPMDSVEFAKKLLDPSIACVVTPGNWISDSVDKVNPGDGYVRFALVPTIHDCKEAAEKIRKLEL